MYRRPAHSRRVNRSGVIARCRSLLVAALTLTVLMSGALAGCTAPDGPVKPSNSGNAADAAEQAGQRPRFHISTEHHWMNDPQRPFFPNGRWHYYYYLYNADYPDGNGTEWFHLTSTDLVHWTDEGIAIHKFDNGLGDIETGSAVVDVDNTAGFGRGAVIAVLTQQDKAVQRQSLFYSRDGGYSFRSHSGNPVLENPGEKNFRDPKIVWDANSGNWLMLLAEGNKISFYSSADLKEWSYRSSFVRNDLGILECPDFFQLDVDGDPAKRTWVLAVSANGYEYGTSTGVVYWAGDWDSRSFTATSGEAQWMDHGADFYAAVTWEDPRLPESERHRSRYAIGWMNNWAYATGLPDRRSKGGRTPPLTSATPSPSRTRPIRARRTWCSKETRPWSARRGAAPRRTWGMRTTIPTVKTSRR